MVVWLIAYFIALGLAKAGEVASVVGAPLGVIGVALTLWGLFPRSSSSVAGQKDAFAPNVTAGRDAYVAGRDMVIKEPPTPPAT